MRFTGIPLTFMSSSIVSLVVPGISVTIALDSLSIAFIKDDFPTFGRPTIATLMPSLKILPVSELPMR